MSNIDLMPCPFCGNPDLLLHQTEYEKTLWVIMCSGCHSEFTVERKRQLIKGRTYTGQMLSNRDNLIHTWNRRVEAETAVACAEWVYDKYMYAHCSECGYEHESPEYITPFCPNCGAKMDTDSEEESEDDVR